MKNNNVLVFGGSGFLGSHVCNRLTNLGYNVTIFDKNESKFIEKKQKMIIGEINSKNDIENIVSQNDYIYNFAGLSDIDEAKEKPIETINQNILSNCIILEACKNKKRIRRYVFASSIYVYSDKGGFYTASKQACENYIENYNKYFGLEYTILRYGSLYGPRSDNRNGIYRFIYDALTKKEMIFNGSENASREFIHVEDAAEDSVNVLSNKFANQHIILTGQQIYKISDVLNMIKEIIQNKNIKIKFNDTHPHVHYTMTPYTFNPKYGKKISPERQIDFGQGLLELIEDIHKKIK